MLGLARVCAEEMPQDATTHACNAHPAGRCHNSELHGVSTHVHAGNIRLLHHLTVWCTANIVTTSSVIITTVAPHLPLQTLHILQAHARAHVVVPPLYLPCIVACRQRWGNAFACADGAQVLVAIREAPRAQEGLCHLLPMLLGAEERHMYHREIAGDAKDGWSVCVCVCV